MKPISVLKSTAYQMLSEASPGQEVFWLVALGRFASRVQGKKGEGKAAQMEREEKEEEVTEELVRAMWTLEKHRKCEGI